MEETERFDSLGRCKECLSGNHGPGKTVMDGDRCVCCGARVVAPKTST